MALIKRYHGNCHCHAVEFEISSPAITQACRCNCSICRRKGAIMSEEYFSPADFSLIKGKKSLTRYQFGDHQVYHYFCKTCGIAPFHDATEKPGYFRVNLNCIDEIDLNLLTIRQIDGASF